MSTLSIDNQPHQGEFLRVVFNLPAKQEDLIRKQEHQKAHPGTWVVDKASFKAVLVSADDSELERRDVVTTRTNAVVSTATALGGEVLETYECVLPDGKLETFSKTVQAAKATLYAMNDVLKKAVISYKFTWGENSSLVQAGATVPYATGNVIRAPMLDSINADNMTVRLALKRSFTRPDGTILTVDETTQALPVNVARTGYTHSDATRTSTELRRFTATHEGVPVSGDFPAVTVPYTVGAVTRAPVLDNLTVRLTVKRSFTRPDGTILTVEETTQALPVNIARAGYTHSDATHTSTELRRFIVTHEGVQVTGDYPSVTVPHAVVPGAAGAPELADEGAFMNARFTVTGTYTRPDNSTYVATVRSYAERWAITEQSQARHVGSCERHTHTGTRNRFTGNSTKTYTTFHQMQTHNRRIATKPDGTEHVIRDWWHVNSYESQGGERHERN